MRQQNSVYPCITPQTRIVSHNGESIIANVATGKWMRLDDKMLICLAHKTQETAIASLLIFASKEEASEFITLLIDNEFVSYTENTSHPPEMQFEAINAYLNVTDFCNLKCRHCYFGSHPSLTHGMSDEDMHKAITRLRAAGIKHLVVAGGEPLSRPNIGELFEHIRSTGFDTVTLLTNGTIHPEKLISTIVKCVTAIHVSVDGPDDASNAVLRGLGSFDRAMHGVEAWKTVGAEHIQVVTTVTSHNIMRIQEMRDLCDRIGVTFGTTIFAEAGRGCQHANLAPNHDDLIRLFLREVKQVEYVHLTKTDVTLAVDAGVSCGAGTIMVSIDCRGDIFPCHFFHQPELLIGNILKDADLQQLMKTSSVAAKFHQSTVEHRQCHGCNVEYFCKGGCLAHAVLAHPEADNPWTERDPLCKVHLAVLGAQMWPSKPQ